MDKLISQYGKSYRCAKDFTDRLSQNSFLSLLIRIEESLTDTNRKEISLLLSQSICPLVCIFLDDHDIHLFSESRLLSAFFYHWVAIIREQLQKNILSKLKLGLHASVHDLDKKLETQYENYKEYARGEELLEDLLNSPNNLLPLSCSSH